MVGHCFAVKHESRGFPAPLACDCGPDIRVFEKGAACRKEGTLSRGPRASAEGRCTHEPRQPESHRNATRSEESEYRYRENNGLAVGRATSRHRGRDANQAKNVG